MQPIGIEINLKHMLMKFLYGVSLSVLFLLFSCNNNGGKNTPVVQDTVTADTAVTTSDTIAAPPVTPALAYHLISRDSLKQIKDSFSKEDMKLIAAINRVDPDIILRPDSLIVPADLTQPYDHYFSFPNEVPFLQQINKIIFFSYPTQTFAAYKNGVLELEGPTSMGKAKTKTPRGLFFTNWKSKESISTSNSEWILKWNFNVANKMGVGFHQYQLPGYPASHSCMRLREEDAKQLYGWADQWVLTPDGGSVTIHGTPVIVFGMYPFGERRPWRNLENDGNYLNISAEEIQEVTQPHLDEILAKQEKRMAWEAGKDTDRTTAHR